MSDTRSSKFEWTLKTIKNYEFYKNTQTYPSAFHLHPSNNPPNSYYPPNSPDWSSPKKSPFSLTLAFLMPSQAPYIICIESSRFFSFFGICFSWSLWRAYRLTTNICRSFSPFVSRRVKVNNKPFPSALQILPLAKYSTNERLM